MKSTKTSTIVPNTINKRAKSSLMIGNDRYYVIGTVEIKSNDIGCDYYVVNDICSMTNRAHKMGGKFLKDAFAKKMAVALYYANNNTRTPAIKITLTQAQFADICKQFNINPDSINITDDGENRIYCTAKNQKTMKPSTPKVAKPKVKKVTASNVNPVDLIKPEPIKGEIIVGSVNDIEWDDTDVVEPANIDLTEENLVDIDEVFAAEVDA